MFYALGYGAVDCVLHFVEFVYGLGFLLERWVCEVEEVVSLGLFSACLGTVALAVLNPSRLPSSLLLLLPAGFGFGPAVLHIEELLFIPSCFGSLVVVSVLTVGLSDEGLVLKWNLLLGVGFRPGSEFIHRLFNVNDF